METIMALYTIKNSGADAMDAGDNQRLELVLGRYFEMAAKPSLSLTIPGNLGIA